MDYNNDIGLGNAAVDILTEQQNQIYQNEYGQFINQNNQNVNYVPNQNDNIVRPNSSQLFPKQYYRPYIQHYNQNPIRKPGKQHFPKNYYKKMYHNIKKKKKGKYYHPDPVVQDIMNNYKPKKKIKQPKNQSSTDLQKILKLVKSIKDKKKKQKKKKPKKKKKIINLGKLPVVKH